jgi:endonuclease I
MISDNFIFEPTTSPFPGLRPFSQSEADIFFGRDEQTNQILQKLNNSRFLAIVGASGCGKSSLAHAGMLNSIQAGMLRKVCSHWLIAEMRPGNSPMRQLAKALLSSTAIGPQRAGQKDAEASIQASLERGPHGIVDVLKDTPPPNKANLLILVDQFEEIFRFRDEGNQDEADAFVSLLLESVKQTSYSVYIVLTMRSDFLGDCAIFSQLPEMINDSQFLTPRMTREQLQEAIEGPARVFNGNMEPALVNRLLNDIGRDPDQLPLLQHALMRMWINAVRRGEVEQKKANPKSKDIIGSPYDSSPTITLKDYEAVGRLETALSKHADSVFEDLTAEQQRIAEIMFRCLTERDDGRRDTRRPSSVEDIAAVAAVKPEQIMEVADFFREPGRNFLMPPPHQPLQPDTMLDISHESLIRQWTRLKVWVGVEAKSAAIFKRLRDTTVLWSNKEAALWRNPDLDKALEWKKLEKPTANWAARYEVNNDGSESFNLAMEFLSQSLRRTFWRKFTYFCITAVVLSAIIAILYFSLQLQATKDLVNERADKVLETGAEYYDEARDTESKAVYYKGIKGNLSSSEQFGQLSKLLIDTHKKKLLYRPALHLYPVVDRWSKDDQPKSSVGGIHSIYGGYEIIDDQPETSEDKSILERLKQNPDVKEKLLQTLSKDITEYNYEIEEFFQPYRGQMYNADHIVPQSWFGTREPMRGDLHHLVICDADCNSFRGNAPYTDFLDFPGDSNQENKSKSRKDCGMRDDTGFEPYTGKGVVARATLYFLLRYPGEINQNSREYTRDKIEILLTWHRDNPVTLYEKHRNQIIFIKQGNRNPLIDYPEWAEKIDFTLGLGPERDTTHADTKVE